MDKRQLKRIFPEKNVIERNWNKMNFSIENPLPLYDDPSNPNAIVIGKINNQDKYKVVGEKYVGDRLYLNIGGWNAADFFNIYSAN